MITNQSTYGNYKESNTSAKNAIEIRAQIPAIQAIIRCHRFLLFIQIKNKIKPIIIPTPPSIAISSNVSLITISIN